MPFQLNPFSLRYLAATVLVLLMTGSLWPDEAEEKAVAFIEKLGGRVEYDNEVPGQPAVKVNLYESKVTNAGLKELAALKNLHSLHLSDYQLTGAKFAGLPDLKKLHTLFLTVNLIEMTDADLRELSRFESLQSVYLQVRWPDRFLKGIGRLKNLRELHLTNNSVTDAGLKELASLKNLHTLNLAGTQVTDAGCKELAHLKSLHTLNLMATKVTDSGLKELTPLKNLRMLKLLGGAITDRGLVLQRSQK